MTVNSVNAETFSDLLAGQKPVLADFWAPWCVHCRRLEEAFDRAAEENADSVVAVKINIDEDRALAAAEGIEVIPTLVLYRNGKRAASVVNPDSAAAINAFIREALNR